MSSLSSSAITVQDIAQPDVSIVATGIDTLSLSARGNLSATLWRHLVQRKEEAQASDGPVAFELSGESVAVRAGGLGRYPIRLDHRYGFVGITSSSALPTVRFQPLAEFLHGIGARN